MGNHVKHLNVFALLLCTLAVASGCARVSIVHGLDGTLSTILTEIAGVYVNCTSSQVTINSMIASGNTSLVHFPSSLNMNDPNLLNATGVMVEFATSQSSLAYVFDNTDTTTAKSMADAVTPSLGTAFQTIFTFVSTSASGSNVSVAYSGAGKSNLTQFTQSLMTSDLYPGLGGLSSTFLPMSLNANALTGMVGTKKVGTFDWTFGMLVSYSTNIAVGPGNHAVDILALLNVDSLAPSSFAYSVGAYMSDVTFSVSSNDTLSYVSSQPGLATPPSRGWSTYPLTNAIGGVFMFGNDASAVSPLTFTFGGTVLSELPPTALLLAATLATTIALTSRRRIQKTRSKTKLGR